MALPLVQPKFQAFDSNGDPLNAGKLYTYAPGTTTPKATYTTAALSVANANPVILDSRGEADVWPSGTTKYVLKDSTDNTIWTVDNVGGNPFVQTCSFRANKNGTNQGSIAAATYTKISFTNEVWDNSGYYDAANSRYTPLVAGRYHINAAMLVSAGLTDGAQYIANIYKNGALYAQTAIVVGAATSATVTAGTLVNLNGSTDYVEAYFYASTGTTTISGATTASYFEGYLVEAT